MLNNLWLTLLEQLRMNGVIVKEVNRGALIVTLYIMYVLVSVVVRLQYTVKPLNM